MYSLYRGKHIAPIIFLIIAISYNITELFDDEKHGAPMSQEYLLQNWKYDQ